MELGPSAAMYIRRSSRQLVLNMSFRIRGRFAPGAH